MFFVLGLASSQLKTFDVPDFSKTNSVVKVHLKFFEDDLKLVTSVKQVGVFVNNTFHKPTSFEGTNFQNELTVSLSSPTYNQTSAKNTSLFKNIQVAVRWHRNLIRKTHCKREDSTISSSRKDRFDVSKNYLSSSMIRRLTSTEWCLFFYTKIWGNYELIQGATWPLN